MFVKLKCLLLVVASSALIPSLGIGSEFIAVLSGRHEIYAHMVDGLRDGLDEQLSVLNVVADEKRVHDVLRHIDSGRFSGIAALGTIACSLVLDRLPSRTPTVLFTYGTTVEVEPDSRCMVVPAVSSLGSHVPVIRGMLPRVRRIAILYRDQAAGLADQASVVGEEGADELELSLFPIDSWSNLRSTTEDALSWGDMLWLPADPEFTSTALAFVLRSSLAAQKPVMASSSRIVRGGALGGLQVNPSELGAAAAQWLRTRGEEQLSPPLPTLWINARVARFLGVPVPSDVVWQRIELIR